MSNDSNNVVGMRVRFLPNFYVTRILPLRDWQGTIIEEEKSLMGQRPKYIVLLDEEFRAEAQEKEVDAIEDEMEQCEQTN